MRKFYNFSLYLMNHRVSRFIFSGGMAAFTNLATLFVLVHFFHVWYLMAAVISFIVSVYVSFMMQKFFTFNDQNKSKTRKQATFYLGFQIFNLSLNTLFMYIGVNFLHIQYLIAQVLIAVVMAIYNFFVYKYLVFTPDDVYNENNQ
mgnify:CR=1 FL=1